MGETQTSEDKIYSILMQDSEITWKSVIQELVNSEQMSVWDIDISRLLQRYLDVLKTMKKHNFAVSGKMLLAAAILLRVKSNKLLTEGIANFDSQLFNSKEDLIGEDIDEPTIILPSGERIPDLVLKTPQPRKRKISLNDLMSALQKALEVNQNRLIRRREEILIEKPRMPLKVFDISKAIHDLYGKIKKLFTMNQKLTFSELIPSDKKEDKIMTFIPLLHLSNQQKVELGQEVPFGEIDIKLIRESYY